MGIVADTIRMDFPPSWLLYMAAALLIGKFVGMLLDRWLWRDVSKSLQQEQAAAQRFNREFSVEEAKQRLLQVLSDPEQFDCEPAIVPVDISPADMPSSLRELAMHYKRIRSAEGWMDIQLQQLPESGYGEGFFTVGWLDEDRTVEVIARPHDDKVYVVYWMLRRSRKDMPAVVEYASLYHCLLHFAKEDA
jgi:hypothetical protein